MRTFLTMKHWQLFLLLIGVPLIGEIIMIAAAIENRGLLYFLVYLPILVVISLGLFFAWFYSLGTNLFKKLPASAGMSLTRFKLFFFVPLVYIGAIGVLMPLLILTGSSDSIHPGPGVFLLIFPIHIFSMFCIFYCLYFISKALKAVEIQRPVVFSDYAGEFLLLWFFPIGIWIIQPRINRLFDDTDLFPGNQG